MEVHTLLVARSIAGNGWGLYNRFYVVKAACYALVLRGWVSQGYTIKYREVKSSQQIKWEH